MVSYLAEKMVSAKKSRSNSSVGNHELLKDVDRDGSDNIPDPFSNEILLGPLDWARLAVGSVILMPVRAIAVILTLVLVRYLFFQISSTDKCSLEYCPLPYTFVVINPLNLQNKVFGCLCDE
jgi:hypothetical protein